VGVGDGDVRAEGLLSTGGGEKEAETRGDRNMGALAASTKFFTVHSIFRSCCCIGFIQVLKT